jgi:lipopolysaccharide transport system permease protein
MFIFFVFIIFKGYSFNSHFFLLPFIYYLQQILAFGIGLSAAVLTVFIRDIREITGVILQLWFWFTPIIYIIDILPDFVKNIMAYNPVYPIILSYQSIIIFNDYPPFKPLLILTVVTHVIIFLAYVMFRHLEKDVRDFL